MTESPYQRVLAMSVEFQWALDHEPEAGAAFDSAGPSHRKQFVRWIASAKQEATLERRAEKALTMLNRGERPL